MTTTASVKYTAQGARVECKTRIDVPREFLWQLIQEPNRRIDWDARLTACDLLTARPLAKGSQTRTTYSLLGWVELEYTSWQPVMRSAVKMVGKSRGNVLSAMVGSWNFSSAADGGTVWKTQIVFRGVGRPRVARLMERLLIGPIFGWLTPLSARRLKALAEREYAAQPQAVAA